MGRILSGKALVARASNSQGLPWQAFQGHRVLWGVQRPLVTNMESSPDGI